MVDVIYTWYLFIYQGRLISVADSGDHCVYVTSFERKLTPLRKLSDEKTPKETTEEDVIGFDFIFCGRCLAW